MATHSSIVSPDPPLISFEAGADGWVAQNAMSGGTALQSSAFATDGAFGLEVTGTTNNWFGRAYDDPLDLSARRALRYDVQTLADDTQTGVRVFSARCAVSHPSARFRRTRPRRWRSI